MQAANKKGVPVVQFNGKASGGDYVTFVGSEQTDSGVKLGQYLAGLYKQLGKDKLQRHLSARRRRPGDRYRAQ